MEKFMMYSQENAKVYPGHASCPIERKPDSADNETATKQEEPTGFCMRISIKKGYKFIS